MSLVVFTGNLSLLEIFPLFLQGTLKSNHLFYRTSITTGHISSFGVWGGGGGGKKTSKLGAVPIGAHRR